MVEDWPCYAKLQASVAALRDSQHNGLDQHNLEYSCKVYNARSGQTRGAKSQQAYLSGLLFAAVD